MGKYRVLAAKKTIEHGFSKDPVTLALGVCEEAGEVAKAVNWYHNPLYVPKPNKEQQPGTVTQETVDVLMFLACLCNALDLDIDF